MVLLEPVFVRGEGCELIDVHGRRFIDGLSGTSAGAMNAVVFTDGFVRGRQRGAISVDAGHAAVHAGERADRLGVVRLLVVSLFAKASDLNDGLFTEVATAVFSARSTSTSVYGFARKPRG